MEYLNVERVSETRKYIETRKLEMELEVYRSRYFGLCQHLEHAIEDLENGKRVTISIENKIMDITCNVETHTSETK